MARSLSIPAALFLLLVPAKVAGADVVQLTSNDVEDRLPAVSGSKVVWQQCDGSSDFACYAGDWELYLWDGSLPIAPIRITDNAVRDSSPDISGSKVVWSVWDGSDSEIYFWDGSFPIAPVPITNNDQEDVSPAISGSKVVWAHCDSSGDNQCANGDWEIYFWDGSFPVVPVPVTDNAINDTNPAISGSKVVWEGYADSLPITVVNLYFWDGTFPIAPILITDNDTLDWRPAISNSTVVWVGFLGGQAEILRWDGSFPVVPAAITHDELGEWAPAISGSNVVWEEHRPIDYEILLWDGDTITNLSRASSIHDQYPDVSGSTVVWEGCLYDSYFGCIEDREIYVVRLSAGPIPAISFAGLVALAGLIIATAVRRRAREKC